MNTIVTFKNLFDLSVHRHNFIGGRGRGSDPTTFWNGDRAPLVESIKSEIAKRGTGIAIACRLSIRL